MYVKDLSTIRLTDLPDVGAKNASLGELQLLSDYDVVVPRGFVSTARAFGDFLEQNRLHAPLADLFSRLARPSYENLAAIGSAARTLLLKASLPEPFATDVLRAYHDLCRGSDLPVTVRSSAIAEGHPDAYFAGRLDSFLNISGEMAVLEAVQHCFASLFNDRAIKYREENSVAHEKTALSVCIQLMVRSDLGASGVAFSTDPDTGFRNAVQISGIWGLSENLAQGASAPDEFLVFKPALASGKQALLQKKLGVKAKTLTYGATPNTLINSDTPAIRRSLFVLDDATITRLARCCVAIEAHYGGPMEIEWASDGVSGQLFILQARPETVQQGDRPDLVTEFRLNKRGAPLTSGCAVGTRVATGTARLIASPDEGDRLQDGDILVTDLARPDWYPVLRRAAAIVTNKGGRSSHASIVARELGVPALVGCGNATDVIRDGDTITVSCCEGSAGNVYAGAVPHTIIEHDFSGMRMPRHTVPMVIASDPDGAFRLNRIPHGGVGLLRLEFLIAHEVKIHPMALARFELLEPGPVRAQVEALTARYPDKKEYFVDKVSQGIAVIAAAVYPRPVLVRMSDLKTNEYAGLIGGAAFEPEEENPMIGFRGASRYDHPAYRDGFALECAAVRRVRTDMGLDNVKLMIPFCRTVAEAGTAIAALAANGLAREIDPELECYLMAEVPSNVLLAEKFATLFDGFSIGSSDLAQLTLGIDRGASLVCDRFNEQDEAARIMIALMIEKANAAGKPVGFCGQAPSDDPGFAQFLVDKGINSISFHPDALLQGIENILIAEAAAGKKAAAAASAEPASARVHG